MDLLVAAKKIIVKTNNGLILNYDSTSLLLTISANKFTCQQVIKEAYDDLEQSGKHAIIIAQSATASEKSGSPGGYLRFSFDVTTDLRRGFHIPMIILKGLKPEFKSLQGT